MNKKFTNPKYTIMKKFSFCFTTTLIKVAVMVGISIFLLISCKNDLITIVPTNPAVSTADVKDVTTNSVSLSANISSDGDAVVSERGFCLGIATGPTITANDFKVSAGVGTGAFASNVSGLKAGTTYYVRSYARNSVGTVYGSDVSFATIAVKYSITLFAGANGKVTAQSDVTSGGSFEVKIIPDLGFTSDSIKINGLSFPLNGSTTYTVLNNITPPVVYVSFKQDTKWALSQHSWYTEKEQNRLVNTTTWYDGYPSDGILINKYEFYQSGNDFKIKTSWPYRGTPVYEYVCTVKNDSIIFGTKLDGSMGRRMKMLQLDSQHLVLSELIEAHDSNGNRVTEKDIEAKYFFGPIMPYQ